MNTKITNLKTELREFIELSKTITQGKWYVEHGHIWDGNNKALFAASGSRKWLPDATFIARSRNISPAMAEALLVAVQLIDLVVKCSTDGCYQKSKEALQQILNIWEAAK